MQISKLVFLLCASSITLQACTPLMLGGGATVASVAHDRRTAGTIVDDNTLEIKVNAAIHEAPEVYNHSHINVTAYNGNVLLTGEAQTPSVVSRATSIAQMINGAKRVINQVTVGRPSSFSERAYDTKQTAKVKTALFNTVDPTHIKVVTEHGITYLMGLVTPQEATLAANTASQVSGVKQIVTLFETSARP